MLSLLPVTVMAEEPTPAVTLPLSPAQVLITELQTGAATASDEFVELYNTSDAAVDITNWQVRYSNSTVIDGSSTLLATIANADASPVLLPGHTHYVLHTASVLLVAGALGQVYTAALSKTDKAVGLFATDLAACQLSVEDAVAWEGSPGTTKGEGSSILVPVAAANKDKLLQRYRDASGLYVDTNNNAADFVLNTVFTGASPGASNAQLLPLPASSSVGNISALAPLHIDGCTVPPPPPDPPSDPVGDPEPTPPADDSPPSVIEPPAADNSDTSSSEEASSPPTIPAVNIGLKSPQLSELLPNPAAPQTDADDEFIELYNPNEVRFDLSGYVLEVGTTTKHRYAFLEGTALQSHAFVAFFAADTHLSLSNTTGQARLIDPVGTVLQESDAYGVAKDNQAWIFANGSWQWTTKPTPNAINVVVAPVVKKAAVASSKQSSKKSSAKVKAAATTSKSKGSSTGTGSAQAGNATTTVAQRDPVHPAVLAVIAASALLYGAYEYRRDVANKIFQLRSNRAARRAARQSAARR